MLLAKEREYAIDTSSYGKHMSTLLKLFNDGDLDSQKGGLRSDVPTLRASCRVSKASGADR